jgi:hypothetical protein
VLLLLIPVVLRGPGVYSSLMKRRLYSWYQLLRDIEKRAARMNMEQIAIAEQALDEMERRLEEKFSISRGYLAGYYDLRMHIALVRGTLRERREEMMGGQAFKNEPEDTAMESAATTIKNIAPEEAHQVPGDSRKSQDQT